MTIHDEILGTKKKDSTNFRDALQNVLESGRGIPNMDEGVSEKFRKIYSIPVDPAKSVAYDVPSVSGEKHRVTVLENGAVVGSGEYARLAALNEEQFIRLGGIEPDNAKEPEPEHMAATPVVEVEPLTLFAKDIPDSDPEIAADPVPGFAVSVPEDVKLTVREIFEVEEPPKEIKPEKAVRDLDIKTLKKMKKGELVTLAMDLIDSNGKVAASPDSQGSGLYLFVNCRSSRAVDDLTDYLKKISSSVSDASSGVEDRIRTLVSECPPEDGTYIVDTACCRFGQEITKCLCELSEYYVVGVW